MNILHDLMVRFGEIHHFCFVAPDDAIFRVRNAISEWLDRIGVTIELDRYSQHTWVFTNKSDAPYGKDGNLKRSPDGSTVYLTDGYTLMVFTRNGENIMIKILFIHQKGNAQCYFNKGSIALGRVIGQGFEPITVSAELAANTETKYYKACPFSTVKI